MVTICLLPVKAGSCEERAFDSAVHSVYEKELCHSQSRLRTLLASLLLLVTCMNFQDASIEDHAGRARRSVGRRKQQQEQKTRMLP